MKKVIFILLTSLTIQSFSQIQSFEPILYEQSMPNEGRPVPHRFLSESRVKYSKRIHRVIDSRMKQNKVISWPKNPLNQIIWYAVTKGYPDVHRPKAFASDSLSTVISIKDIKAKVEDTVMVTIVNPQNPTDVNDLIQVPRFVPYDPSTIDKFRIMEDWIFDFQHGDFKPRIIAIAPLYNMVSQSGVDLGEQVLFWVKMKDLRPTLAQQPLFNNKNDAARLSYDHWFEMRLFASHIVKKSNIYDLDITHLQRFRDNGVEALLESDRIKNDLFILEHDLWEY
ncbi:MAG: gliding motility protein GldN [Bacteroidia bacterium]